MLNKIKDKLNLRIIQHNDFYLPCLITFAGLIFGIILFSSTPQLQLRFYNKFYSWSIYLSFLVFIIHRKRLILFITSISLGLLIASNWIENEKKLTELFSDSNMNRYTIFGKVSSHPVSKHEMWNYKLKNVKIHFNGNEISIPKMTFNFRIKERINLYDKVILTAQVKPVQNFNKLTFQLKSPILINSEKDKSILIKTSIALYNYINHALIKIKSQSSKAILRSLLTADRTELSEVQKRVFKESGMYHLLALSGLHVIVVLSFLFIILKPIPILQIYKDILIIISIWLFFIAVAAPPTLFRATFAATIYLSAKLFQRKGNSKNALGAAGLIWLLLYPMDLFSPSFQLSFTASFIILEIIPTINRCKKIISNTLFNLVYSSIITPTIISITVIIFTSPILLYHFGSLSLGALILNIPALLLTNISIYLFLAGTLCSNSFIGEWLLSLSSFFINLLFDMIKLASYKFDLQIFLPSISVICIVFIILIFLMIKLLPKLTLASRGIISLSLGLIIFPLSIPYTAINDNNFIIMKDVDQNYISITQNRHYNITSIKKINSYNQFKLCCQIDEWRKRSGCNTINLLILEESKQIDLILSSVNNIKINNIVFRKRINEETRELLNTLSIEHNFRYFDCENKKLKITRKTEESIIIEISKDRIEIKQTNFNNQVYNFNATNNFSTKKNYILQKVKVDSRYLIRI